MAPACEPLPRSDDRCYRQPERRRGEDHDRHQSGRRALAARQAHAARRSRPPGEQLDVVSRRPDITRSVYDAIVEPTVGFADIILPSTQPNLFIAPSQIALAKLESKLVGELDAHFRLKDRLEPIQADYPNIVIDCPPTLGLLTVNALVAATHLLIPIQSSYFALEGTDDLLETVEKVRGRANPNLRILGVVITMHDKRTALARDIRSQIDRGLRAERSSRP